MFASPRQSGRAEAPVGRCVGDHIQAGQIGDRAVVFGLWMSVVPQSARVNGSERGESRQDAEAHSLLAARAFRRTPQPARSAGATDRVRSRLRLHGGRCRRERELKRCHTSPRREPIRGPGEAPSGRRQRVMAIGRVSPASDRERPPLTSLPQGLVPPGAPGATHLKIMSLACTPVSLPGTNENPAGARAIRDVEIICDQGLGPAWNLEWAAREADTRENFCGERGIHQVPAFARSAWTL